MEKNILTLTRILTKISKEELNKLLVDFYPNTRKKNRGNYEKTALTSIRFGLQRYAFELPNQVFEAVVVQLKRHGFAKVNHHEPIDKKDLIKIYMSASCISSVEEEGRIFAFKLNSRFESELMRPDDNMSTRSWMNSTNCRLS